MPEQFPDVHAALWVLCGWSSYFFYVPTVLPVYTLIDLTTVNYLFLEEKKINANTQLVLSIYDLFGMC